MDKLLDSHITIVEYLFPTVLIWVPEVVSEMYQIMLGHWIIFQMDETAREH